jgi:phosphohistidine phosphatase SixA
MKLYLVQHGDAVPGDTDIARPLSQKGKRDVRQLGDFLARNGIAVSRITHSGKLRAQQTAETIASRLRTNVSVGAQDGLNPNDPARRVAQILVQSDDDTLVGATSRFLASSYPASSLETRSRALFRSFPAVRYALSVARRAVGQFRGW